MTPFENAVSVGGKRYHKLFLQICAEVSATTAEEVSRHLRAMNALSTAGLCEGYSADAIDEQYWDFQISPSKLSRPQGQELARRALREAYAAWKSSGVGDR